MHPKVPGFVYVLSNGQEISFPRPGDPGLPPGEVPGVDPSEVLEVVEHHLGVVEKISGDAEELMLARVKVREATILTKTGQVKLKAIFKLKKKQGAPQEVPGPRVTDPSVTAPTPEKPEGFDRPTPFYGSKAAHPESEPTDGPGSEVAGAADPEED